MLNHSDRTVEGIVVTVLLALLLSLVGIGFVLGKLDNNLPICERIVIKDGANVSHEFEVCRGEK